VYPPYRTWRKASSLCRRPQEKPPSAWITCTSPPSPLSWTSKKPWAGFKEIWMAYVPGKFFTFFFRSFVSFFRLPVIPWTASDNSFLFHPCHFLSPRALSLKIHTYPVP
jgi:hypothetical protein